MDDKDQAARQQRIRSLTSKIAYCDEFIDNCMAQVDSLRRERARLVTERLDLTIFERNLKQTKQSPSD